MHLNTIDELKECLPERTGKHQTDENVEIIRFLDESLHGEHRTIYLKIKYGNKVYKNETDKLLVKIREILSDE